MLPEEIKKKTEHPESLYSFGWSHGKEKMKEGKPDIAKGSYYANPQYNVPFEDKEIVEKYPAFAHPNIWPGEPTYTHTRTHPCADAVQWMTCLSLRLRSWLLVN